MTHNERALDIALTTQEFSELIGDIYEAVHTEDWSVPFDKISDITQSNKIFFLLQDIEASEPLLMVSKFNFDYPTEALVDFQSRHTEDPFRVVTNTLTEGESCHVNAYLQQSDLEKTDFYHKILVPMQSHHCLAGCLIRDGSHESAWAINRGPQDPAYSDQDINLVKLLTDHLSRAVRIYRDLKLYKNYANITQNILNQTEKGIIVCDETGTIELSNEFADELVTKGHCLAYHGNKLALTDPLDHKRLQHYIGQSTALSYTGVDLQETMVLENSDGSQALISVAPLRNHKGIGIAGRPCALITLTLQSSLNWSLLVSQFKLTPKETKLLRAIYSKNKLKDLVDVFGVSYNTLRSHLQNIFRKVGVNSQAELMIKLNLFKA